MANPTHRSLPSLIVAAALVALLVAACGSDSEPEPFAGGATTVAGGPDPTTTTTSEQPNTDGTQPSSASSDSSTVAPSTGSTGLPGEPFEGFVSDGDELGVVGVAHDDVLNVRAGPGTDQAIVAQLDSLADGVVATGRGRRLTRTIWYEVRSGAVTGWSNSSFLAFHGTVDDVTADIIEQLGSRPVTETMLELGELVAQARSSDDVDSRVVLSVAPTVGDVGEVTYDVIGLADDALYGYRLHVFGQPIESGEGFSLGSVEQTSLCGRGIDDIGRCR